MYAVIKTGGKQYRVAPGDVLVVEKLDALDPGAAVTFDQVLMVGGADGAVTVGAPLVEGATVTATLIETRKAAKIKVFKKIRRQGYRRTQGHRQPESVLRVTGLSGGGGEATWEGTVDLTPRAELVARARGLAPRVNAPDSAHLPEGTPTAETSDIETLAPTPRRTRKAAAPATPAPDIEITDTAPLGASALVEQPVSEAPAGAPETSVDTDAADETGSMVSAEASAAKRKPEAEPQGVQGGPGGDTEV